MSLRTMSLAAMIVLLCLAIAGPVNAVYTVGQHVDDFTLPNAAGQNISLYDYQDRIVVMPFWFTN